MTTEYNQNKHILTDVDNVLLSWNGGFDQFMARMGHTKAPNSDHHYRLSLHYPEYNDKEMNELVEDFNTSDNIKCLEPWKDAVKYVNILSNAGYHFTCITAMSLHPTAKLNRQINLDTVFGKGIFTDMICLPVGASKHAALQPYAGTCNWWIEDHFRHAESGYELGLRSILMDTPTNRRFQTDLFPRVHSWEGIHSIIINSD